MKDHTDRCRHPAAKRGRDGVGVLTPTAPCACMAGVVGPKHAYPNNAGNAWPVGALASRAWKLQPPPEHNHQPHPCSPQPSPALTTAAAVITGLSLAPLPTALGARWLRPLFPMAPLAFWPTHACVAKQGKEAGSGRGESEAGPAGTLCCRREFWMCKAPVVAHVKYVVTPVCCKDKGCVWFGNADAGGNWWSWRSKRS